jgi:RNA polymerase sigma-70 factor, ECF subfamily
MIGAEFGDVLVCAQAGAADALGVLWRDLHPRLVRFLRVLAPQVAEDVESETWLAVARDLGTFNGGEDAFRAWVFTVARHRLVDWQRRAARRATVPLDGVADRPAADDPIQVALEDEELEAALAVLRRLPRDQAEVILLRVLAGFSAAQVAIMLGKREGTVRVLQHRGLRRLAELVPREPLGSRL